MILLGKLLYDVTLGVPVTLGKKVIEGIRDEIDRERLVTEDSVKQKLQESQLLLQDGQLSEEDYEEIEGQLIERLRAIREYRKEVA